MLPVVDFVVICNKTRSKQGLAMRCSPKRRHGLLFFACRFPSSLFVAVRHVALGNSTWALCIRSVCDREKPHNSGQQSVICRLCAFHRAQIPAIFATSVNSPISHRGPQPVFWGSCRLNLPCPHPQAPPSPICTCEVGASPPYLPSLAHT